jgi:hypothetical protein
MSATRERPTSAMLVLISRFIVSTTAVTPASPFAATP